jgi:hypothetical protein
VDANQVKDRRLKGVLLRNVPGDIFKEDEAI